MLTILKRRDGYTPNQVIETFYHNMKPGLHLHIRQKAALTSEKLIQRVQEIDEV